MRTTFARLVTLASLAATCGVGVACGSVADGPFGACDGGSASLVAAEGGATDDGGATDASLATDGTIGDGATSEGAAPEAAAFSSALVRVANWSPDAPAVDFCVAPHGTSVFQGPLVGGLAAATDSGATALTFPLVSAYLGIPPGQYDVRIVVAGATTCTVGIGGDLTTLPPLVANAYATIALIGENLPSGGDPGLHAVGFTDGASSTGGVSLRFFNAMPAFPQVTVGKSTLTKTNFVPYFSGVPYGSLTTAPEAQVPDAAPAAVDAQGYALGLTLKNATLSAHPPGATADTIVTTGLYAAAGSTLTIALVGGNSAGTPPRMLECVDNAGTIGALSNCNLLP
jgi:hypothetical protein